MFFCLKVNLCFFIRDPCLLKSIIFVFFVLISSFHLSQYASSLLRHFCRPSFEVDMITRSSAYFKHLNGIVLSREIGAFSADVIVFGMSLIYKLKRIVLRLSPYLTPVLLVNFSPIQSLYTVKFRI